MTDRTYIAIDLKSFYASVDHGNKCFSCFIITPGIKGFDNIRMLNIIS